MLVFVFSFSQGFPFQTPAAQRFTTVCINLQMWLSSGFEVAEFASLLDPYVNVSKLFQRRRDTPSSSFNLQIDTDTNRLSGTQQMYRGDTTPPLRKTEISFVASCPSGLMVLLTWREGSLFTLSHRRTVQLSSLVLQMSVCVAKMSFPTVSRSTGSC